MKEKLIEYSPNRVYKYFSIIFLVFAIWAAFQVIQFVFYGNKESALFAFLLFGTTVYLVINLNNFSKQKIIFTQEAIYVEQNKCRERITFYYEDFLYAYYCRDNNARLNLVLSTEQLEFKRVKKIVNRIINSKQTVTETYIMFFVNERKTGNQIKKLINQKIPNIYTERCLKMFE